MKRSTKIAIGAVTLTLAAVLWWLLSDDPTIRYSTDIEDYVPSTPEGVANYERLLELSKNTPETTALSKASEKWYHARDDSEKVSAYIAEHAAQAEAEIAALEPQFAELRELAQSGPIGSDAEELGGPSIQFSGIRALTRGVPLQTELCIAKQNDECGIDNLLAMLQVSANWHAHARTSVDSMVAIVMQKTALDSLKHVLPKLSAAQLRQAQAVLQADKKQYDLQFYQTRWAEFAIFANHFEDYTESLNPAMKLLLLKNATLNDYGRLISESQQRYERGDVPVDAAAEEYFEDATRIHPKNLHNLSGRLLIAMAYSDYSGVLEQAREVNARQDKLLSAIEKRLAELDTEEANNEPAGATP